ncbi:hypothetical protein B0H13DRAFT_2423735 [Mycena leptocephala]|nr:hypothetical protein B0H13DRAFT_2423735 [Mycena leptocephala]
MLSEQDIDSAIENAGDRAVFTFQLTDATRNIIFLCGKWYSLWEKQLASAGYPGKAGDKTKVPKGLHFKNGTGNTYTGSAVSKERSKEKRAAVQAATLTRMSNSFGPLAAFDEGADADDKERTLEENLARELIGADDLDAAFLLSSASTDNGKGKEKEATSFTPGASPSVSDAGKQLARKLAGLPFTPVPIQTSMASSAVPWLPVHCPVAPAIAPMTPAAVSTSPPEIAPTTPAIVQATTPTMATTSAPVTVQITTPVVAQTTAPVVVQTNTPVVAQTAIPVATPSAATASVSPDIIAAITGTSANMVPAANNPPSTASLGGVPVLAPIVAAAPAITQIVPPPAPPAPLTAQVAPAPPVHPAPAVAAAPPVRQVAAVPINSPSTATTFAAVAGTQPSSAPVTRSAARRAQATTSSTPQATSVVSPAASAPPVPITAVAQPAPVAAAAPPAPAAPPPALPAIPPVLPTAPPPLVAAPPAVVAGPPAAVLIQLPAVAAPLAQAIVPAGAAPLAQGLVPAAVGLVPTLIPQGTVAIYGWNAENVNTNVANRQTAGWNGMTGPKATIYEFDGSHHTATTIPSDFIERCKTTLSNYFGIPAPLIGPAEPVRKPTVLAPPFHYLLSHLPAHHTQTLVNHVVWSFPSITFVALPYPPPISRFLGTIDGLLYSNTNGDAVAVATLVATTLATSTDAQAFLTRVHDNYPADVNPMAHFLSTILVYAVELSNPGGTTRIAWNVTAQPPTTNVQHQNTFIGIFAATTFPTDFYYVGTVMDPPLSCGRCKSLGHPGGRCPIPMIPGIHVPAIAPTQTASSTAATANQGIQGRGRGNAGRTRGRGAGSRARSRGRGF